MLTTLLGSIQSALTSFLKGFVVVALLPTVYFVGVNLLLLSLVGVGWADAPHLTAFAKDGIPLAMAIVLVCAAAFVLTTLQPWLLQLLEGEHLPDSLCRLLHRRQVTRLDALSDRAAGALVAMELLRKQRAVLHAVAGFGAQPSAAARRLVDDLWERRNAGLDIDPDLPAVVRAFAQPPAAPVAGAPAVDLVGRIRRVANYGYDRGKFRHFHAQNQMQFRFPGDVFDSTPLSDNVLAPTAFGNIGRTMRSYALRRYAIDLDIFWMRFQKTIADSQNKAMFETLQTQKALVDFSVTTFWLSVLIAAVWIPWLGVERLHPRVFRAVAAAAPCVVWAMYQAACHAYLLFADHVRTCVDLFRFDVIRAFHLAEPVGTLEEQALWERLGGQVGYANQTAMFLYARNQP